MENTMENTTVKELIKILSQMNPDALVCGFDIDEDPNLSTFEICREFNDVAYIDDSGATKYGDVVAFY